jgi:hypothetical protein
MKEKSVANSKTIKLIKKLKDAYKVCKDCGTKYGVYSVGCSSSWIGRCDVCGDEKSVTEARDYGYLMTGIRKLALKKEETPMEDEVKYTSKTTEMEIHRHDGASHAFTVVRIDDEGGGEFISLSDNDGGTIRLDFEELDLVVAAVRQMRPK